MALALTALIAAVSPVAAHGDGHGGGFHGGGHFDRGHFHGFFFFDGGLGVPYGYGYPYPYLYVDPYAYANPYSPPAGGGAWYYCAASNAYYPYVATCAVPWQAVTPQPR